MRAAGFNVTVRPTVFHHAGPAYRDIAALFDQSRERLKPGGRLYVMVSSDSDLDCLVADRRGRIPRPPRPRALDLHRNAHPFMSCSQVRAVIPTVTNAIRLRLCTDCQSSRRASSGSMIGMPWRIG